MSNPREAVFAAITSQLESIRIDNGYGVDIDRVYRLDVLPDDMVGTRCLSVLESLSPEQWTFLDSGASGGYLGRMMITVAGIVKSGTTDLKTSTRHTELNYLINATVRALMLDPTFGGACKESKLDGPVGFVDTDKGEALFNITLHVIYAFGWGDL